MSLPARAVLLLTALVVAAGAGWRLGVKTTEARWNAERLVQTRAQAEAEKLARAAERADTIRTQEAANAEVHRLKMQIVRAADNRRAADGVRNAAAAIADAAEADAAAACDGERAQLARVARLLGEGAGLVAEGASLVERLDSAVILARDSWPKE